ncbi:hypothetical protein [Acuticoccus sediminis]|uniref:hypothetical protein n=1 Tax=Acuticoccus sediminis TaxID=2184697 RepID=UPI001CFE8181|nr:hypothetical protein [Acuticoccus sediminis]
MRSSRRYVSGSVASDWVCAVVGLLAALIVGAAAYGTIIVTMPTALADVEDNSGDVSLTVAQSVAADLGRAVALGIPLDEMRGVEDYLKGVLSFAPQVEDIAILDRTERVLFEAGTGEPAIERLHTRAPILDPDSQQSLGVVIAHASTATRDDVERAVIAGAVAISILAGLITAIALRIVRLERLDLPTVRTAAMLQSAAHGHFVERGLIPSGLLLPVSDALARAMTPIQLGYRRIQALSEEIKAVDGSAGVRQRLAAATGELADLRLERRRGRLRTIGFVWWPAAALSVLMATRPLTANFAYDRIGDSPFAAIPVALAVSAESAGALLGVLVAVALGGRLSKPVTFVSMLIAAAAFAAVYVVRDYRMFTALVGLASFAGWLAVWTVLQAPGAGRRMPWRGALVLLGAAAIGPIVGGILAEAEGRRAAFATLGALAALLAVASTAGAPRWRQAHRPAAGLASAEVLALIGVSLATFAWADVHLSATVLRERYAVLALDFGIAGVAAFVPYLLRVRLPAVVGAMVAAAAVLVGAEVVSVPALHGIGADAGLAVTSGLTGLGFGMVAFALGARAFIPSAAVAMGVGGIAAGALHALSMIEPGAGIVLAAVGAGALSLLSLVASISRALGWAR